MKNRPKRILTLLLVLVLIFGLLACNKKKSPHSIVAAGNTKIVVGLSSNYNILDFEDNALTNWLEEICKVELSFKDVSGLDIGHHSTESFLAAIEDVDILWGRQMTSSGVSFLGQEGYFADLQPYYADKEGVSRIFWERLSELPQYQQDQILAKITDPNTGAIYTVPTVETRLTDGICGLAWINQSWLDRLNLEMPESPEELYAVLTAFRENDCNGNGDTTDEIPLFGSQNTGCEAAVVDWLINMFIYYHDGHLWQDYDGDGQIEAAYTTEAYRNALKFANKLYEERLLSSMVFTASSGEMKGVITPSSNIAQCGIFLGDLTHNTTYNSEVLYEYVAMPTFGCATREDIACVANCFITDAAVKKGITDQCFELLMAMWSREGSMRIRYGEYGVNWTEPTAGTTTADGVAAEVKVLDDPHMKQTTANWGKTACTLLQYANGENVQTPEGTEQWELVKAQMLGQARTYFDQAEKNINPTFLETPFLTDFNLNSEDEKKINPNIYNLNSVFGTYFKSFVTGEKGMDINKDAHWQQFLNELDREGYEKVRAMYQKYYEMQK